MPAWLAPAITAAGMGISAAIAKGKDKRQLNQQGKLNEQQIEANSKWLDIQNQKGFEMWQKTGPTGMMGELQKAGLNAGLMYGMGGAGGQSMGADGAGVSAPNAPRGSGRETEDAVGMAMQLGLMKAQKENIEADTANKLGDAANKPKVGENLEAQTGNTAADTILKKANTELANLEVKYQGESMSDRLQLVAGEAVQAVQKGMQEVQNTAISEATKDDTIKRLKAEAVGAILRNVKTRAETTNIGAQTSAIQEGELKTRQDRMNSIQEIMLKWREMGLQERRVKLQEMMDIGNDDAGQKTMNAVMDAIDNIIYMRAIPGAPGPKPIQGFGGKR